MSKSKHQQQKDAFPKEEIDIFFLGAEGSGKTAFIRSLLKEKQPLKTGGPTLEYCKTTLFDKTRFDNL